MPDRQHFLPASFIGGFSLDQGDKLRRRAVWVARVGSGTIYETAAENVAWRRGFYDLLQPHGEQKTLDTSWAYEQRLPEAIDALISPRTPLDASLWCEVLVPFVASLFVRGPDFNSRFSGRLPGVTDVDSPSFPPRADNTNHARLIEWQRLLAPTMGARWTVVHGTGRPLLVTSNLAHCLSSTPDQQEKAHAIPLSPTATLVVDRQYRRPIAAWQDGRWVALIEHRFTDDSDFDQLRRAIRATATEEVYGPTRHAVGLDLCNSLSSPPTGPGPCFLTYLQGSQLIPYEFDWYRLVGALRQGPAEVGEALRVINWGAVAESWTSTAFFALNLPMYSGGLEVNRGVIRLDLTRLPPPSASHTFA